MSNNTLGLNEVDNVLIEHVRASLLKIIVRVQGSSSSAEIEKSLKYLVEHLDGLQIAYDISNRQEYLPLEPVNIKEITESTMQSLSAYDFARGIKLINQITHKEPVLAHRNSLIRSLDSMLRAALDFANYDGPVSMVLSTKKIGDCLRVGVFSDAIEINASELKSFNQNVGTSRRPSANMSANTAAHLYVASTLSEAMGIKFRTAIHSKNRGLAMVLPFSTQLQLISI